MLNKLFNQTPENVPMRIPSLPGYFLLPQHLWLLLVLFFTANLAHFAHNAEFIAYYPNMPRWITRETVYWTWLAGASLGVAGLLLCRLRLPRLGALLLAAFGATGLAGLLHYTLALCSEHTWVSNVTIWAEVASGFLLALAALRQAASRLLNVPG